MAWLQCGIVLNLKGMECQEWTTTCSDLYRNQADPGSHNFLGAGFKFLGEGGTGNKPISIVNVDKNLKFHWLDPLPRMIVVYIHVCT